MPREFPIDHTENAGNAIHGNAPFEMFSNAVHARDTARIRQAGHSSFADFVNHECTHLIFTMANTLRDGEEDGSKYDRLATFIGAIEKPVVIFGLGVQSTSSDPDAIRLPESAGTAMRLIADKCALLGVRGEMTAHVLRSQYGISNVRVTGCPSLLSRPDGLAALKRLSPDHYTDGRPAFNGTKLHLESEKAALYSAIKADHFMVESANRRNHAFHLATSRGEDGEIPYFLKGFTGSKRALARKSSTEAHLRQWFRSSYRLFRDPETWYSFNRECVSYTYGTRFHGNMASILSGRPALWITHDARTEELTDFAALPSISQEAFDAEGWEGVPTRLDYEPFFERIDDLYANFNDYLTQNGLPQVRTVGDVLRDD